MIKDFHSKNSLFLVFLTTTLGIVFLTSNPLPSFSQDDTGMMGEDTTGDMMDNSTTMNATLAFAQEGNATMANMTSTEEEEEHGEYGAEGINVRDSVTVLLEGMTLPGQDFIHLYDSTPSKILDGHVAIKFPCDEQSVTPIQVLIGSAPNLTNATLENLPELSTPGEMCLYHADLVPSGNQTITDVALMNPTEDDIDFPDTSSVVIGVNKITKGEHEGEHGEEAGHEEE
ncbi:MAG: hypothetical protein MRJ93_13985 [Nitrososphaeraceae archaeon]|nr:hypothetical protein [Nitrososphaeraceae archaeon]